MALTLTTKSSWILVAHIAGKLLSVEKTPISFRKLRSQSPTHHDKTTTYTANNEYKDLRLKCENLADELAIAHQNPNSYLVDIEDLESERNDLKRQLELTIEQLSNVREQHSEQARINPGLQ